MMTREAKRKKIENVVDDLVGAFVYYDRKECDGLGVDDLPQAIRDGVITVDEIIERFARGVRASLTEALEPR